MLTKIKKKLPLGIKQVIRTNYIRYKIFGQSSVYKEAVDRVRKKDVINIAFLVVNESIWKYKYFYFLLKNDPRYNPMVFICPFVTYGEEIMRDEIHQTCVNFESKGYDVQNTLLADGSWLDIKKSFKPDLVFFCTPWEHSLPKYHIYNFLDVLSAYVPYGFKTSDLYNEHFNRDLQNLCWKFFVETPIHKKLAKKYGTRRGKNVEVTGFPGMDGFLKISEKNFSVWKNGNSKKKRVIWAPHHTIPGTQSLLDYSTFLDYADFMLEIAERYENEIDFSFKPHPNLKGKLNDVWGKEKTEHYYNKWMNLSNGQIDEGEYIDLFATSDAMIHDSGSFIIEYLYTQNPVMFLVGSEKVKEQFNEIGVEALKVLYQGYTRDDITDFIENKVLESNDNMREKRIDFFEKIVKPPNNVLASENIYNYINEQLK